MCCKCPICVYTLQRLVLFLPHRCRMHDPAQPPSVMLTCMSAGCPRPWPRRSWSNSSPSMGASSLPASLSTRSQVSMGQRLLYPNILIQSQNASSVKYKKRLGRIDFVWDYSIYLANGEFQVLVLKCLCYILTLPILYCGQYWQVREK